MAQPLRYIQLTGEFAANGAIQRFSHFRYHSGGTAGYDRNNSWNIGGGTFLQFQLGLERSGYTSSLKNTRVPAPNPSDPSGPQSKSISIEWNLSAGHYRVIARASGGGMRGFTSRLRLRGNPANPV